MRADLRCAVSYAERLAVACGRPRGSEYDGIHEGARHRGRAHSGARHSRVRLHLGSGVLMSTTLNPRPAEAVAQTRRRHSRRMVYVMMRLTGVLLAVLVTGHLLVTHVVTDVAGTDAGFIAKRWGSALWVTWDSLML